MDVCKFLSETEAIMRRELEREFLRDMEAMLTELRARAKPGVIGELRGEIEKRFFGEEGLPRETELRPREAELREALEATAKIAELRRSICGGA